MEGLSPLGECHLCKSSQDVTNAIAAPGSGGTQASMLTAWENAGKQITSFYMTAFPTSGRPAYNPNGTPSNPYPMYAPLHFYWAWGEQIPDNSSTFQDMVAGSSGVMRTYPERVGIKSNGLHNGSRGFVESVGCTWHPTNPIGFQTVKILVSPNDTFPDLQAAFDVAAQSCGGFVEEAANGINEAPPSVLQHGYNVLEEP
jgi:hypothetical protein